MRTRSIRPKQEFLLNVKKIVYTKSTGKGKKKETG